MYQKGITLIELVVTLAILGCLSICALQNNNYLYKKNELLIIKKNLISAIRYAKIIAIAKEEDLYLSPQVKENWSPGIALYSYKNHELLYQWQWKHPTWIIHWHGFQDDGNFRVAIHPYNSASNGQFVLLNKVSGEKFYLKVNRLGRILELD